jgi:hypothetical protein
LSIFLTPKDLQFLFLLNSLPSFVTGLNTQIPCANVQGLSQEALDKLGFSLSDIESFYIFYLVTEIMSKIDSTLKRVATLLGIVDGEIKTRPSEQEIFLSGSATSLAMIVNNQLRRKQSILDGTMHPIQDVVRQVGSKVTELLNLFSGTSVDPRELVSSPLLSVLNFSFDKKARYSKDLISPLGDRRVLEKTLRTLFRLVDNKDNKSISFIGAMEGVSSLWVVKVGIGIPLTVFPHIPRLSVVTEGGDERLRLASNTFSLKKMIS